MNPPFKRQIELSLNQGKKYHILFGFVFIKCRKENCIGKLSLEIVSWTEKPGSHANTYIPNSLPRCLYSGNNK